MEEQATSHSALGHFALVLLGPPSRGQSLRADLQINPDFLLNTPALSCSPETSEILSMYISMHPELFKKTLQTCCTRQYERVISI